MSNMADGLNMLPRPGEPESALTPGMAAPVSQPPDVALEASQLAAGGRSAGGGQNMPDTSIQPPQPPGLNLQEPGRWVYDFDPASGQSRATFNGLVQFSEGGSETAGVTSFNGRTGVVILEAADLEAAGALANPSPALEGTPTAPTAPLGDSSTTVATTAFVAQAIAAKPLVASFNGRTGAILLTASDIQSAGGAPAASPALTGTPTAPTAAQGNASSQVATTQFVANAIASGSVVSFNGRVGVVALQLSDLTSVGGAPIASPAFTGTPTATTAPAGDATTRLATTAFVTNAITGATVGVASFNTRTGAVTLTAADVIAAGGAPLVSPVFTGSPQAPTPAVGNSSDAIATTQFVENALGAMDAVQTFNGRTGTVTLQLSDVTAVGGAPAASPVLTGSPSAPTPTAGDNSTLISTTAFVETAIAPLATTAATNAAIAAATAPLAPLASPTLTGTPAAPTPPLSDSSTRLATTAFVRTGVTDGSEPAAGEIGEYVQAIVAGAPVSSGVQGNLGVLNLSAGDWDVTGAAGFLTTGSLATIVVSLSLVSDTQGNLPAMSLITTPGAGQLGTQWYGNVGPLRVNVASATTVYMVVAVYSDGAGTISASSVLQARRMR